MNEQLIGDLFAEATRRMTGSSSKEFSQKFAELIVEECITICNKIYFERYPDAEDFERSEEGDAIKKHFGVEL